jgi:hypothetical protein
MHVCQLEEREFGTADQYVLVQAKKAPGRELVSPCVGANALSFVPILGCGDQHIDWTRNNAQRRQVNLTLELSEGTLRADALAKDGQNAPLLGPLGMVDSLAAKRLEGGVVADK